VIGPGSAVRRLARSAVRRVLRIGHLRKVVEAELTAARRAAPGPAVPVIALPQPTFVDAHGTEHVLDPGLRDRLKPAWRTMCDPDEAAAPPSDEVLRGRARKAVTTVGELERVLDLVAGVAVGGRILEVGCYDGAVGFELSRRPGTTVIGSDLARYYVVQRPGVPEDAAIEAQAIALAELRERARSIAAVPPGSVTFVEDDITSSALQPGSLDRIVSFEVLEHLSRPAAAFAAMAALLRPGGIVYHDYNPYFSINGGHSLVTLDFPWGHARLSPDDLERYMRTIRPAEAEQALRFARESLNRMTLADLRSAMGDGGLEILAVLSWGDRGLLGTLPPTALAEVRRSWPSATLDDLLSTYVTVVARRPVVG
jgi:SAM-dependent methyltransferase